MNIVPRMQMNNFRPAGGLLDTQPTQYMQNLASRYMAQTPSFQTMQMPAQMPQGMMSNPYMGKQMNYLGGGNIGQPAGSTAAGTMPGATQVDPLQALADSGGYTVQQMREMLGI